MLAALLQRLRYGMHWSTTHGGIVACRGQGGLSGVDVTTGPYPEFTTDLQAAAAAGASTVTETIFEQRFRHADELRRMGASIAVVGRPLSCAASRGCTALRSPARMFAPPPRWSLPR